jgi:hypothetical protein
MKRVPVKGSNKEGLPNEPRRSSGGGNNSIDVTTRCFTSGSNDMQVSMVNILPSMIPSQNVAISSRNASPLYFRPADNNASLRAMLLQNRIYQLRSAISLQTTIPCFFTPDSFSEAVASRQASSSAQHAALVDEITQKYVNNSLLGGG